MMDEKLKKNVLNRLKRVEGQVGGLQRMVEEDRYCIDILIQANSIRSALKRAEEAIMKQHLETCVSEAMQKNPSQEKQKKIDEVMDILTKFGGNS